MVTQRMLDDPPAWYPFAVLGGFFTALLLVSAYNREDKKA